MFADTTYNDPATAYTCSRPAMMSESNAPAQGAAPPQLVGSVTMENTCTATMRAPFATPLNGTPAVAPLPVALPATCVPSMHSAREPGAAPPRPSCWLVPFGHADWLVPAIVPQQHAPPVTFPPRDR